MKTKNKKKQCVDEASHVHKCMDKICSAVKMNEKAANDNEIKISFFSYWM